METKTELNCVTKEKLRNLVRINIDSDDGFTEASEAIEDKSIATLFIELARQRRNNARELQELISLSDETAALQGSYITALHRAWLNLRGMIGGGDAYAILSETERGEDAIKSAYEDVMPAVYGTPIHDLLAKQYARVKADHDKVKSMRDRSESQ